MFWNSHRNAVQILAAMAAALSLATGSLPAQAAPNPFVLAFEDMAIATDGRKPSLASGLRYEAGKTGRGARFTSNSRLQFPAAGILDSREGSLAFWIKPSWSGADGRGHTFLEYGSAGGIVAAKDGAGNLRMIFNRYSANGRPELQAMVVVHLRRVSEEPKLFTETIVSMEEPPQTDRVHLEGLREGERLAGEPPQPLPKRVVPPLDMGRLSRLLPDCGMLSLRDDMGVGVPEVTVAVIRSECLRD